MGVVGHRSGVQTRAVLGAAGLVVLVGACGWPSTPSQVPSSPPPAAVATPTAQGLLGTALAFDQQLPGVVAFGGREASRTQVGPSSSAWRWTGDQWAPLTSATSVTSPPDAERRAADDVRLEPARRGRYRYEPRTASYYVVRMSVRRYRSWL